MNSKFTFSFEHCDSFGNVAKTYNLTTNEVSLMALIEDFETFLKGSGFVFDGILDIIEPESMEISPQDQAEMDAMFPVGGDPFPPMEPFDTAVNKTTTHSKWYYDTERNK
jgi:hypothetical protein